MDTTLPARFVLPVALLLAASFNSVSLPAQGTQSLMQPPIGRFWLDRGSLTRSCQVDLRASDRVEVTTGTFDCGAFAGAAEAVALPWGSRSRWATFRSSRTSSPAFPRGSTTTPSQASRSWADITFPAR